MGFDPVYKEKAKELGQVLADRQCELLYGAGSVGLMKTIAERHPKILMEQMIVTHSKRERVYKNTNGVCFTQTAPDAYLVHRAYSHRMQVVRRQG